MNKNRNYTSFLLIFSPSVFIEAAGASKDLGQKRLFKPIFETSGIAGIAARGHFSWKMLGDLFGASTRGFGWFTLTVLDGFVTVLDGFVMVLDGLWF